MHTKNNTAVNGKKWSCLSLLLFLFFGYSCKKDSSSHPAYHVTCKVNGVARKFNVGDGVVIAHGSGETSVGLRGLADSTSTTTGIGFVIINDPSKNPIVKGTYVDSSSLFQVLASYGPIQNEESEDYVAGSEVYNDAVHAGITISNDFKATITSLTSQAVSGTFSGEFYRYDGDITSAEKVNVTDGDFYVKILQ
jgi:hypothetical protein